MRDKKRFTRGILTDGDLRRYSQKNQNMHSIAIKKIMKKNPIGIDKNELAAKALALMANKNIISALISLSTSMYSSTAVFIKFSA